VSKRERDGEEKKDLILRLGKVPEMGRERSRKIKRDPPWDWEKF